MKELAQGIASLGRGPDTELVHMTKGEVAGLQHLALAHGGSLTINPHTGLPEAGFLSSILPMLAGAVTMAFGGGPWGAALAGGLTGMVTNKDRPGMGAITGAMGGYGGANLSSMLTGAGEAAASAEFAKQTAAAGTDAFNTAMKVPVEAFNPAGANTSDLIGYDVANQLGPDAAATAQRQAAEMARAGVVDNMVPPQQSYFEKLASGASNLPKGTLTDKKTLTNAGLAAAPLAMGLMGGSSKGLGGPGSNLPYSTSSVPFSKAQASTRETRFQDPNAPYGPEYAYFTGNRTYGPGNSLANYGAASGGLASLKGFADGGGVEYPDLNFFQPQPRTDTLQQKINYFGEPEGYADGGMPKVPERGPIRFNAENSGFFDASPARVSAPATGGGTPAAGGYTPFSLYGPGGFKSAAAQIAPPTQAQATAAAPKPAAPAPAAPAPAATDPIIYWGDYGGYMAEGGAVGYAQGGIADLTPTYAAGGKLLRGPGDGVSDSIPAVITGPKPQRAALADGEFVVPARIVSELGNGSTEAGARKLYAMMDRVQYARRKSIGKDKVAVNSRADKLLPA
jgi:hypothetical protein